MSEKRIGHTQIETNYFIVKLITILNNYACTTLQGEIKGKNKDTNLMCQGK